jgi:hypothetical protein
MGLTGLPPSPESPGKSHILESGGAKSGALPDAPRPIDLDDLIPVDDENPLDDPDLDRLVRAWADLPGAIKAGIIAMLNAAGGGR